MTANDNSSRQSVTDEAALWHARLDSGTADHDEFEAWRNADPLHAVAFARMIATADSLDILRIDQPKIATPQPEKKSINRRKLFQIGAGIVGVSVVVPLWGITQSRAHASTPVGARETISLPDGSRLSLNTNSNVSWKIDSHSRQIWLERGEISVVVAPAQNPCLLFSGDRTVSLAAGSLNARLRGKTLDLTMLEGKCVVSKSAAKPETIRAGEAALIGPSDTHVRQLTQVDIQVTKSWQTDEVIIDGQLLAVAVEEYNRYLTDKIVIADPELDGIRLGGRFSTRDPDGFLSGLRGSFGIHVSHGRDGTTILSR